jgi:tRNA (guanine-N7-)-methyltransferase
MDPAPLRPYETTWEDWLLGGGAERRFPDPSLPLEVEIGPGEDDFLLESALAHPEENWLGIEYSRKRVRRYVRRLERCEPRPENLRLIWRPAADLVGPFLTPERVQGYHVNFPDPWPKKHHARYRLLTPEFATALRESLVPGGTVTIATDTPAYVEEILDAFRQVPGVVNDLSAPGWGVPEPGPRATVFERRWREAGRRIYSLRFRKSGGSRPGGRSG